MDNDDIQVGRILSRREVLRLLGVASAAVLVGCGPANSTTLTTTTQTTAAPLNAEAQTAAAAENDPGTVATQQAEVATAEAANTEIAAATDGTALPSCIVRPELTEGPYYVDENLVRSDIRTDPATG